jgi:tRNA(Ile)-lysidine synthase
MVFEVLGVLNSESGAEIQSESHRITKDRSHLVISELGINSAMPKLSFQTLNRNQFDSLITDSNVALLDADKLDESKLKLRKWKQGDRFKPLGMNCWKLLSDFFIDQKLSVPEKDKIWLLTFHENVVWIVGHRIDNRYKITEDTQKVLKVTAQY